MTSKREDREALIEEAAKAIWIERNAGADIGWGEMAWAELTASDDWNQEALDVLEEARAALAVFEQAHTPTDDEREALIEEAAYERYPDIEANPETFPTGWSRESERNAFIAGVMFERAHTPTDDEPVAYGIYGRVTGNLKYVQVMDEQEVAEQSEFYDVVPLFRRPVQGEPTCQHGTPLTELCEHVERLVNAEPQGEPNTWSVERAAVALYRLDHPAYLLHTFEAVPLLDTVLAYRKRAWAALRAAAVPEGENRG